MKISLEDIEVGDLNNVCILLISKFARVLREHNGEVVSLRDRHVVRAVARHATRAKNPALDVLYMKLKVEIKKHLNHDNQRNVGVKGWTGWLKAG